MSKSDKLCYNNFDNKGRYSRGRRGGPAKAVGRATGARVQIPLFPPALVGEHIFANSQGVKIWKF